MATDDGVLALLERLWGAYDAAPKGTADEVAKRVENAVDAWARYLNGYSDDECGEAADAWMEASERMPNVVQLGTEVQRLRRGRGIDDRNEAAAALEGGMAPELKLPIPRARVGKALVAAWRMAIDEARRGNHNHGVRQKLDRETGMLVFDDEGEPVYTFGAASCDICSERPEVRAERERVAATDCYREISRYFDEDFEPTYDPDDPDMQTVVDVMLRCPKKGCDGHGWVETDGEHRPCSQCNAALHERWAGGHLKPGHTCSECEELAVGRRPRSRRKASAR